MGFLGKRFWEKDFGKEFLFLKELFNDII